MQWCAISLNHSKDAIHVFKETIIYKEKLPFSITCACYLMDSVASQFKSHYAVTDL